MRARSTLLTIAAVIVAVSAGLLVGRASLRPPDSAAGPSAATAEPARPTAPPSPTAVGTLAPDGLRVFAIGALPADFRFVLVGDAGDERLLLLDLGARRVTLAAHFEGSGAFAKERQVEIASLASGALLVLMVGADGPESRIYLIRPVAGEVRTIVLARSQQPRLSPDGRSLALARQSIDSSRNGIWVVDLDSGTERRLVSEDAGIVGSPPKPAAWSPDGRWLAILPTLGPGGDEVAIVDPAAGQTHFDAGRNAFTGGMARIVGPGQGARWRGPELVLWSARSFIGGPDLLAVYDPATDTSRRLYTPPAGRSIGRVEVSTATGAIATLESTTSGTELWLRAGAQPDRMVLDRAADAIAYWWSADGRQLYVWINDNGTTTVSDALTGTTVVTFCLRQKVAPPCS